MSERAVYLPTVNESATRYGVRPALLDSVLQQESGYALDVINGDRLSSAGAAGIAQFMPATAAAYGVDVLDPQSSIDGAARYLRDLLGIYNGDELKAVAAYNAGPGRVDDAVRMGEDEGRSWTDFLPDETQIYLPAIFGSEALDMLSLGIPNPLGPITDVGYALGKITGALFDPTLWAKLGFTLVGGSMIIVGVMLYSKQARGAAMMAIPGGGVAKAAKGVAATSGAAGAAGAAGAIA